MGSIRCSTQKPILMNLDSRKAIEGGPAYNNAGILLNAEMRTVYLTRQHKILSLVIISQINIKYSKALDRIVFHKKHVNIILLHLFFFFLLNY